MTYKIDDILDVLSEKTSDYLFDIYDSVLFTEGEKFDKAKETFNKVKNKVTETKNKALDTKAGKVVKKVGSGAGSVYNAATEAPGVVAAGVAATVDAVAKKKSLKGLLPEIRKGFQQRIIKYRANAKVGVTVAVLLAKGVLVGPLDWIITAIMASGLTKDTEVNRETKRKLDVLKSKVFDLLGKVKTIANKYKDKDSTDKDFKSEYDALMQEGNVIAGEADSVMRDTKLAKPVTESTIIEKFDRYILNESGVLVDNAFSILSTIVEKTDYDKYDIYPVLEHYFALAD